MSIENGKISTNDRVRIPGRYELGAGEVLRVCESGGEYIADVVFETRSGRRLESLPASRLERADVAVGKATARPV